ncbi:MAG: hypothetical protein COC01_10670, partial [Bacteroidetes bacterium]
SATGQNATPGYSYSWSNGAITQTINNLTAGNYTVTVTDANGCKANSTVNITEPTTLSVTTSSTDVSCNGGSNGTAGSTPSGGTGPYTYSWNNTATTQNINSLTANTYTVTITDANGCKIGATATVNQPTAIILTSGSQQSTCGNADGTAGVTATGGTPGYTYKWSNNQTTQAAINLTAGAYELTVTDNNGCQATATINVSDAGGPVAEMIDSNDVTINGLCNGDATVSQNGGTPGFTYSWSSGATTAQATSLCVGSYLVTVTDANGCISVATVTINEPPALWGVTTVTNVSCFGGSDGTVKVSANGGTLPYTYSWSNGETTQSISNLSAGNYTITVTDNSGALYLETAVVTQPTDLSVTATITDVSCNGTCDGEIDITASGGTPGYTYSWSNSATSQDVNSLCQGSYGVTITDANGCVEIASSNISQPTVLSVSLAKTDVSCNAGNNGDATATPSGGTAPYTFSWSDNQSTPVASNLTANNYCVTVTDNNGCKVSACINVTEPTALVITGLVGVDAGCSGSCDGTADLTVSGGTPGYSYDWSNNESTEDISNLCIGNYTVTVIDNQGCKTGSSVVISEPTGLTISVTGTNVSCNAVCDGSADVIASGGTQPYSYSWSNGATSLAVQSLCAGMYNITITDNNGCKIGDNVIITEPAVLGVSLSKTDLLCNGDNSGSIDLTVTGGTLPYTYFWSPTNQTTEDITEIAAGNYAIVVTDANGCQTASNMTVAEPVAMNLLLAGTDLNCFQDNTGEIDLTITDGTPSYTYSWSNGETTQNIASLDTGKYVVVVTDDNNCQITDSLNIAQPDELTSSVTGTNTLCNGDSNGGVDLTVNGGTAPYTYNWSNGITTEDVGSLAAGNYTVQITDDHGCITFDQIDITEPALLQVSLTQQEVSCYNGSDGSIDITPTGGTQPYSYNWTPEGQTTEDLNGISKGTYNVVVTDNNGCTVGTGTTITQPDSMVYNMNSTPASCYGYGDGTASVNVVSGGTAPFSYSWNTNPGQSNATANGLAIGTYSVTITDNNNCQMVGSVNVTQPDTLIPTIVDIDSVVCNSDSDGAVDLTVSGGNGGYTYVWDDANNTQTQDLQGVPTGTYTVIVTDAKGCTGTAFAFVGEPEALVIIRVIKGQTCPGFNDAWAEVQVSGGIEPYSYYWSTGQTGDVANNLYAGTYSISVLDKNGCVAIKQQIEITNFADVEADFLADPYEASILSPEIDFYDSSKSTVQIISWDWDFGDGDVSTLTNPMHEYSDTGYFPVTLLVINEFGCADTIIDTIRIKPEAAIYIPNAFTPDGDGINDAWGAKTFGMTEFELYVYDRWGEMIFRTEDPNHLWNGRLDNVGELSPDGVYPYLILGKDHTGRAHRYIGHVVLLK